MAAIANACGLDVPAEGLLFPSLRRSTICRTSCGRRSRGGVLERGPAWWTVVSLRSSATEGRCFCDLRWGVYVVLEAPNDYAADCFRQYGLKTDGSGRLRCDVQALSSDRARAEISVLSAALRGEPTGRPTGFRGDVAAIAKRNLRAGEMLGRRRRLQRSGASWCRLPRA